MRAAVLKQKEHYEAMHERYAAHYFDTTSMAFRERFMYDVMFAGLDLNGKDVADLACGSGYNSLWVRKRFPNARVCGFDISDKACAEYRELVGCDARLLDLTGGDTGGSLFDAALIVGGLHHCVCDLPGAIRTIAQLVRPGGLLLMVEPNRRYFLQSIRRLWYRFDANFEADTEDALDHAALSVLGARYFEPVNVRYMGGPAYFLICNSMIFRVPYVAKRVLASVLFPIESAFNRLPGKFFFPYFVARWKRRATSASGELRVAG
jgi:SAM-dependent methyltransferase